MGGSYCQVMTGFLGGRVTREHSAVAHRSSSWGNFRVNVEPKIRIMILPGP